MNDFLIQRTIEVSPRRDHAQQLINCGCQLGNQPMLDMQFVADRGQAIRRAKEHWINTHCQRPLPGICQPDTMAVRYLNAVVTDEQ